MHLLVLSRTRACSFLKTACRITSIILVTPKLKKANAPHHVQDFEYFHGIVVKSSVELQGGFYEHARATSLLMLKSSEPYKLADLGKVWRGTESFVQPSEGFC